MKQCIVGQVLVVLAAIWSVVSSVRSFVSTFLSLASEHSCTSRGQYTVCVSNGFLC